MPLNVTENLKQATLSMLYGQSIRISVSHMLASLVFVFWLVNHVPFQELLLWYTAICAICIARISIYFTYKKHHVNKLNVNMWMHAWAGVSFVLASCYSIGFIQFIPLDQPAYIISVAGFVIAFASAAMISYGASFYGVLSFIIPLSLPTAVYFWFNGGVYGSMTTTAILAYAIIIISLLKSTIQNFKKANLHAYQLQQEIDKRAVIEKQLQEISRRDSLTGLFNRRYFDEVLETEIGRAYRNHASLCLLMFDVDCFKEYNDQYGHVAGDNCLIKIAEIVTKLTSRKGDLIARYGGEEFAVILPNIDLKGAVSFANKFQQGVQKHKIEHLSTKLTSLKCVTVSVGVTNLMPFTKMTAKEMIVAADNALYEAKRDGRNRVQYFENTGIATDHL